MTDLLYTLALLACPVGMGAMMWFMMRGHKHDSNSPDSASPDEVARLRAEVDQLRAEQKADAELSGQQR